MYYTDTAAAMSIASNVLDVPNFFWDSEPTLHPLYAAIREYLEIDLRIKVLNERCRVFLDLAEILSDSVADAKMSSITWIVIILILVSILVTVTEVGLRFAMLEKSKREPGEGNDTSRINGRAPHAAIHDVTWAKDADPVAVPALMTHQLTSRKEIPSDLEVLARSLGLQSNASLEDVKNGISELQRHVGCPST